MSTTLAGIITNITFQNEETGYTVLQLTPEGSAMPCTCVGTMPTIAKGESVSLQGAWERHRKFGDQFTVERYEIIRPVTAEGIVQLLGSGLITNIGPVRARQIVGKFGLATLDILDTNPDRLGELSGIGPKTLSKIKEAWQRQSHIRDIMLFLREIGVSVGFATKIYKTYGASAREKISQDPYALLEDVWGVGFVKADQIAQKMGFSHDSYKRIRAGIIYLLTDAAGSGHCYLPADALCTRAAELLGVGAELVVMTLDHVVQSLQLIRENNRVFLPLYYNAEKKVAELLDARVSGCLTDNNAAFRAGLKNWLAAYQAGRGWSADPKQAEAVTAALSNKIFLLTGGPGTGKTTILQVIVSWLREHNRKVALAAPTGRAAQRMGSIAGLSAQTIHRLLEFKGGSGGGGYRFSRNEQNPIDTEVLIVDEMSMIDLLLMRSLLAAVRPETSVVFVGDSNQLPSVGAGNVLADLIASRIIPHAHLTTIFRQAAQSRIVTAAHEIIRGEVPEFTNGQNDNCFFLVQNDPGRCAETIVDCVVRRLPARYGFDPVNDIQVLSPMHKGVLGTQNLTAVLQKALNHSASKISRGSTEFILGDKVLQLRNNYDTGVFNGDLGIVTAVDEEEGLTVAFGQMSVQYGLKDLDELQPAYCMSIHKSQGSEFRAVVIPLSTQHFVLLQRNLLYTAITRAREICVLVGSPRALAIAVDNNAAIERYSSLPERLV
ncbi:MAG: ATP-dependent RecD-like DNA helicase [Chitinispirillaceae bacterium]|nr:ATP-dependent RecD-like DNA helicase [Chitinispirillaceae bacterium]